jgi:hypothetical protein
VVWNAHKTQGTLTYESDGESLGEEDALDLDGLLHDLIDPVMRKLVHQVLIHQAGKVCVQALVPNEKNAMKNKIKRQI